MLNAMDLQEIIARFGRFVQLSPEKKLEYFQFKAPGICSDEWRRKIEQFLREGGNRSHKLVDDVFTHLQLEVLDGEKVTTACTGCRTAFWQMVWLSTDMDCH